MDEGLLSHPRPYKPMFLCWINTKNGQNKNDFCNSFYGIKKFFKNNNPANLYIWDHFQTLANAREQTFNAMNI